MVPKWTQRAQSLVLLFNELYHVWGLFTAKFRFLLLVPMGTVVRVVAESADF